MRATLVLFCFSCSVLWHAAVAQLRYDAAQSETLEASAQQWLVLELAAVNRTYFNCETSGWSFPQAGDFELYGDSLNLSQEQITRFQNIWFPAGDCKRFLSVIAMADVYMPLFKRKAEQLSLHPDVAYLPVVLSGCNQQFRRADAAGLWALPYLAARKQHLKIDTLVDERLGGDFTTDAALKHFRYVLDLQRNDYWRATVAYIDGPSQLQPADSLKRGAHLVSILDGESADRLRFLAYTKSLLKSIHLENQLSNCFDILGHFQPVILDKPIQVKAVAAVLSIDEMRLRNTNPVFTGNYLLPGYRKVPFVLEDTLIARFQLMRDSIARWQPPRPRVESTEWELYWVNHRVGKGETLGRIAGKYHVTIALIKKWNKLRNDKIRKGQVLRIEQRRKVVIELPTEPELPIDLIEPGENLTDTLKVKPAADVVGAAPNEKEPDAVKQELKKTSPTNRTVAEKNKYYTVKSGDSLWSIARKYPGVTEQDLMKWNKCSPNIRPGQKLLIKKK